MSTRRYSSEYKALRPFIIEEIRGILGGSVAVAGAVGGIASHALNDTSIHTGQLAQMQAPWASTKNELATHAANPDAHHAKQHLLANASGLGSDHTISGAMAGWVLRATASNAARMAQLQHTDLGGVTADQHHAQVHGIVSSDHTVTGAQYQIVGLTATNTLGLLTPSANPGAAAAILATTGAGALTLKTLTVSDFLYVDGTLDFGTNTIYEDATYLQVAGAKPIRFGQNIGNASWTVYSAGGADFAGSVNITGNSNLYVSGTVGGASGVLQTLNDRVGILCVPDPQFALDVAGPARAQYFIGPHAIQLKDALLIAHYDGPERGPVGEPNGHMGQVPTVTGDVRYRLGKFGKALENSEAVANLLTNPSFETNTTGWSNYATGAAAGTRTRTDESAWDGYYAYRLVKTGGAAADRWGASTSFAVTNGQAYAATVRVRLADAGGVTGGVVVFRAETNVAAVQVTHAAIDGEWAELTLRTTATATGTANLYIWLHNCTGATVYVDAVQVTATAAERPFWGGGGASAAGSLTYANQPVRWERFTLSAWVRLEASAGDRGRTLSIAEVRADNLNRYSLAFSNTTDRLTLFLAGGGATLTLTSDTAAAARTWHHMAFTFANGAATLYLNGASVASGTLGGVPTGLASVYVTTNSFGDTLNGMVDDFALVNRALTATEVRAIYESNAPVFAESSVWSWRATPNGLVWADENGLWMRDTTGAHVLGVYGGAAGAYSWGGQSLDTGDLLIGRANAYVLWDNSAATLEVAGSIKATAGYIGGTTTGWAITAGQLSSANITLLADPANASVLVGGGADLGGGLYGLGGLTTGAAAGDTVLWLGKLHADRATAPFRVTLAGALTATNAVITGSITATSGSITGTLTIGISGKITAGSTEISSSGILLPRTTITQGDDVFDSPDLTPGVSLTTRYSDTAATWNGADGTYNYAGNTVMRLYSSSVHYVDGGLIGGLWAHALDGVIEAPAPAVPANSGSWMRRLWLLAGAKFLTVGTGGVANGVGVNVYNPQKALHVGGTLLIDGDEGGYFNTVGLTNVTDTSVSTGTGTVKMNSTTARNSDAWIKVYIGTTAYWIPAWSNIN